ncbi:TIGR04222 domain-containing membrane protein [Actinosynnema sp. CS-041913]|uniref:TIGR04222 domain-containing membrane protein n=1 Tax=Actinosynnema sp. CS-041913 TaxID=3239917 RepID=UPI003D92887D
MATSWTPTSAGSAELWPEEQGLLAGGPGRAAEVAIVSLVEAGAVRISRDGVVSAVHTQIRSWSPLQAYVMRSLPRSLGDLVPAVAGSPEAESLRQSLIGRGLVRSPGQRKAVRWARRLVMLGLVAVLALTAADYLQAGHTVGGIVLGVLLLLLIGRAGRPLTRSGRAAVRRLDAVATTSNRVALVAYYGLLGKVGNHLVWEVLGLAPRASATLKRRARGTDSSASGGGCGSCSSSSCGSASGSDGGSSCGGGGGGCGGGGGGGD